MIRLAYRIVGCILSNKKKQSFPMDNLGDSIFNGYYDIKSECVTWRNRGMRELRLWNKEW